MEKNNFFEQAKKTTHDILDEIGKKVEKVLQEILEPQRPYNPQRRKMMRSVATVWWVGLLGWSMGLLILWKKNNKESDKTTINQYDPQNIVRMIEENQQIKKMHTITLHHWDTVRWRTHDLYQSLWIEKIMHTIYPQEYIDEKIQGQWIDQKTAELIRFNLFFIAVQEELFFFQENEKDIYQSYKAWDTITFKPENIIINIANNKELKREEREIRLKKRAESKKKNTRKTQDTPPSLTELHKERKKAAAQKAKKEHDQHEEDEEHKTKNHENTNTPNPKPEPKPEPEPKPKPEPEPKPWPKSSKKKNTQSPSPGQSKNKLSVAENFISNNSDIAQEEMKRYGIPASIKLAQAMLEWANWRSRLARTANNHFGIKCHIHQQEAARNYAKTKKAEPAYYRQWKKCCINANDDHSYDMFRIFDSKDNSFREHSALLAGNSRYAFLLQETNSKKEWDEHFIAIHWTQITANKKNSEKQKTYNRRKKYRWEAYNNRDITYKKRAYWLSAMWYATSEQYPQKIMKLVEKYNLTQYDK